MTTLGARALNRAALARQFLLERSDTGVLDAVAHLGGLQAQEPQEPFVGLWSRLCGFDPAALDTLLRDRRVVRTDLMRRTVHLVTAADALARRERHEAPPPARRGGRRGARPGGAGPAARAVAHGRGSPVRADGDLARRGARGIVGNGGGTGPGGT